MIDNEQPFEEFLAENYQETVELAQDALDRGDNQLALELAEECLEQRQFDVEVLNICAVAATNLNDLVKAHGLFAKALQLNPRNGALHHNYAVLLDRQRNFKEAVTHLEKALELQPDFPEAYINLGNVLDELDRTEDALGKYREALRRMPDSHDAFYNIGYACNRLGRYQEALSNFTRAIEIDRADAGSLNGAGFALSNLGRLEEAGSYYDRAIALAPENATYRFNRGLMYLRLQHFDEARTDFECSLEIEPDFPEALLELMAALVELNQIEELEPLIERVEQLDSASPEPAFFRALVAERNGELLQALEYLDECLRKGPGSLQVLNNKGNVLLGLRRLEKAMECFDHILTCDPDYALAHFNRSCVLAQQRQLEASLASLTRALELDSTLASEVMEDPDFEPLRSHPDFQTLLEKNMNEESR